MSKIEVDAIDKQSGSTLTLGGSGTAVTLACGATQTGFGREGSVNWQTGSIKTTTFTAVSGEGYFVDTSSGAVTVNLPAGSAGAIVAFADYTRTFATHNLTITPNGSNKIGGIASDTLTLTHITASGNISSSGNLFVTQNVDVDGTSNFVGNMILQNNLTTLGNVSSSGNIHTEGNITASQIVIKGAAPDARHWKIKNTLPYQFYINENVKRI